MNLEVVLLTSELDQSLPVFTQLTTMMNALSINCHQVMIGSMINQEDNHSISLTEENSAYVSSSDFVLINLDNYSAITTCYLNKLHELNPSNIVAFSLSNRKSDSDNSIDSLIDNPFIRNKVNRVINNYDDLLQELVSLSIAAKTQSCQVIENEDNLILANN